MWVLIWLNDFLIIHKPPCSFNLFYVRESSWKCLTRHLDCGDLVIVVKAVKWDQSTIKYTQVTLEYLWTTHHEIMVPGVLSPRGADGSGWTGPRHDQVGPKFLPKKKVWPKFENTSQHILIWSAQVVQHPH